MSLDFPWILVNFLVALESSDNAVIVGLPNRWNQSVSPGDQLLFPLCHFIS